MVTDMAVRRGVSAGQRAAGLPLLLSPNPRPNRFIAARKRAGCSAGVYRVPFALLQLPCLQLGG